MGDSPSEPSHPLMDLGRLALILPLAFLLKVAWTTPSRLLDFWWHLAAGRLMVVTGELPRHEPFSFTATKEIFVFQNWLAELFYYAVHRLAGLDGLLALHGLCLVAAAALCLRDIRRRCPGRGWALLLFVPTALSLSAYASARPQIFGFLFFALAVHLLTRAREGRRTSPAWLPLLMIPWANVHGSFVLGLALVIVHALGSLWEAPEEGPPRSGSPRLPFTAFLCLLATFLNPEGPRLWSEIFSVISHAGVRNFVLEWQPPDPTSPSGWLCFFLPLSMSLTLLVLSRRRPGITEAMSVLLFAFLGLFVLRNGVWFALLAPVALAPLSRKLPLPPFLERLAAPLAPPRRHRGLQGILAGLTLLVLMAGLSAASPWWRGRSDPTRLLDSRLPLAALDVLSDCPPGPVFHPQAWGDHLIWKLWPRFRSFLDGRVHLFDPPFIDAYRRMWTCKTPDEILARWKIHYLLLPAPGLLPDTPSARLIRDLGVRSKWILLYRDDRAWLFRRATPWRPHGTVPGPGRERGR